MDINKKLYDPSAIMYVIGCLIQKPSLLAEIDKVKLSKNDFDDKFTKAIFLAIENLYKNGNSVITASDVEAYLNQNIMAGKIFKDNNGLNYLNDAEDLSNLENFDYYYNRVKKFSALRDLQEKGYSIKKIYDDDVVTLDKQQKMLEQFDSMTLKDIFDTILLDYSSLESEYVGKLSGGRGVISDGMRELQVNLKKTPEVGFALQGEILNTILRGARKTKFYLRSGATGSGKSRLAVGDACGLSFPVRYSKRDKKWVRSGFTEKVLFITTEMAVDEIQTMIWAYLSDVNEEKILFHQYEDDEEQRVEEAIRIAEKYKNNFYWEHIPDPTIESVSASIRNQVRNNGVTHVFYDYIFSSPSLLREFSGQNIREDVVLGMLSTKLKELANELEIFLASATQLNRSWENEAKTGIRNQNMIRGSTAIIDKADAGFITLPVMPEELKALENVIQMNGYKKPTHVTDIYKLRRGRWKFVRVWSLIDLGTCRCEDLFVTDPIYNPVSIPVLKYNYSDWND